jgi:hypothetical protein
MQRLIVSASGVVSSPAALTRAKTISRRDARRVQHE